MMLAAATALCLAQEGPPRGAGEHRREMQDRLGGVPARILKLQSDEKVRPPTREAACARAAAAAREAARPLIDREHHRGQRHVVPDDFKTIQGALDAAAGGDVVVVRPGVYFEQLVMKDGVKLVSDAAQGGDEPVAVEGARLRLPRRTLRTILDGSRAKASPRGMIDFNPGLGRHTIVDGFTIRNLPAQDHHLPGHAHGINVRGASPVIMNCYVHRNGSTAIGNHVVYADQGRPLAERDFRGANIRHRSAAVIYHNVISGNLGLGIGCNHFSAPLVLGNEVFGNSDADLGGPPSPGVGAKHGAAPTILGNVVHQNPGGGILSRVGKPQGAHRIDGPTQPTVTRNVVYNNGSLRPGISCSGGGSLRQPVRFSGNMVYDAGAVGIGLSDGAVGIVEDNVVAGSAASGIAIDGAIALKLNRNRVTRAKGPGFVIVRGAHVTEMIGNAADSNAGPRFVLRGATIGRDAGGK
jgi:hypothetical protein